MKATTKNLVKSTYELFMSQNPVLTNTPYYKMMFDTSNSPKMQRCAVANFIQTFSFNAALILQSVHEDRLLFDKLNSAYCYMMQYLILESF